MSKHELVEAYSLGMISRRVFIRRLVALGVSAGAALVYAESVGGGVAPASATTTDFYPPPANTPGKVTGGGFINPSSGGKGTFGFVVQFSSGDPAPRGNLRYTDQQTKLDLKATSIDTLVIGAGLCGPNTHSKFAGKATVDGMPDQNFEVEVDDCGEPGLARGGGGDTFKITVTGPSKLYAASGPVTGGNIQVHRD